LERDVGILINNAGVMYKSPNRFLQQSDEDDYNQIMVNCTGLTLMTRTCLPGMVKRKRGLVINLSSVAGYQPLPLMGVYSASKVTHSIDSFSLLISD
jgi:short-subunit dehydrogenase